MQPQNYQKRNERCNILQTKAHHTIYILLIMQISGWIFSPNRVSNEEYECLFSVPEVPQNNIITLTRCYALAFSERSVPFPGVQSCFTCTCFTAPHAHVVPSHMHMSYCFTCTSKTMLHTEVSYVTL